MIVFNHEQRSPEWFQARLGCVGGSRASDVVAEIKTGEAAARRDLRTQLVCEILTGQSQEQPIIGNPDIDRGVELEPQARTVYEWRTGSIVTEVGFIRHDTLRAGVSLDGAVGDKGFIEIKCPRPANHLATLKAGKVPSKNMAQLLHAFFITQREWCDFISYCPALPEHLSFFCTRVHATDVDVGGYIEKLTQFLDEVDAEVKFFQQWETK